MFAEVMSIGDEVTSGRILDTNVQWLSQRLEEIGFRVLYHTAVGDDLGRLTEAFSHAIKRSAVVMATGGLGPTADDLTREALAGAVDRRLVTDEDALEQIREMFARRWRQMPPRNQLQAQFPEGARVVPNPNGTAPGIDLDAPRPDGSACRVICLPGVPSEMKEMWFDSVAQRLSEGNRGLRIVHTQVKCFGAGESQIEAMLPDGFLRQVDPVVGINASETSIILRIAAKGATAQQCREKTAPVVEVLRQRLGALVFGEGDDELETVVLRLLASRQKTLAVADLGTGGLIAERLGAVDAGNSRYLGSVVGGSPPMLRQTLSIAAEAMADPTSREAAEAMATGCRRLYEADFALGVGQRPEIVAEEPRPISIAMASESGVLIKQLPYAGNPGLLRAWTAKVALNLVRLALLES